MAEVFISKFSDASALSLNYNSYAISRIFKKRFERELEALRKELADTTARSGRSSPTSLDTLSCAPSDEDLLTPSSSPLVMNKDLPVTPNNVSAPVSDTTLADKKAQ